MKRSIASLILCGLLLAVFHLLLSAGLIPESMTPCVQDVPCSTVQIQWLGFVTIPLLSAGAFLIINLLLIATHFKSKK